MTAAEAEGLSDQGLRIGKNHFHQKSEVSDMQLLTGMIRADQSKTNSEAAADCSITGRMHGSRNFSNVWKRFSYIFMFSVLGCRLFFFSNMHSRFMV